MHALSVEKLEIPEEVTQAQVRFAIFANQLDSASLTGRFKLTGSAN
ncbi:YbhB/YbcL family Raf kinase inhibitor-like protein [Dermabacter jinjuensis]|nr:hypothetical protein [Dermabacter jinjuensis]